MKSIIKICCALTIILLSAGCKKDGLDHLNAISVVLNQSEIYLEIDESIRLIAKVNPDSRADMAIIWSSEDDEIAVVDADGLVKGVGEGETKIFATVKGHKNYCKVTVSKPKVAVSAIELNTNEIELEKDEEYHLVATVSPTDATDPTVTWVSSDPQGVSVDGEGNIKALQHGVVVNITAKAGDKTAVCVVTVEPEYVDYPTSSYQLSSDGKILEKWLGAEEHINMNIDSKLKDVERIGVGFEDNTVIKSIVIGDKVKVISAYAFTVAENLSSVILPNGLETIGAFAFNETGLQSVSFPNSLKTIDNGAFRMTKLVSVTVPESVENFGNSDVFHSCAELVYAKLPNSATRIEYTFYNCPKLETLVLGNAVAFFEEWSMDGCVSLRNIEIASTTPPEAKANVFSSLPLSQITLKIPVGAKTAYNSSVYVWSGFTDVEEKQF